jgi:hypothetical protein
MDLAALFGIGNDFGGREGCLRQAGDGHDGQEDNPSRRINPAL